LVGYQIPSKGEAWGNTSNPLQFTLDNNGFAWFTEWTENKIGVLDSEKAKSLPLWISIQENSTTINLDKEKIVVENLSRLLFIHKSSLNAATEEEPVEMTVSGTISHTGKLWNLTGQFSKEVIM
jgi:hypothetical protein